MNSKKIVEEAFRQIWNEGKVDLVEKYYSKSFKGHYSFFPWEDEGPRQIRKVVENVRTSFPDYKETIQQIIEADEWVTVRLTITGTNTGPNPFSSKPTGKRIEFEEILICRVADGKIQEQWGSPDTAGMLKQLGLLRIGRPD